MKSKSPVLVLEERYTCELAGDLEAFIDMLTQEAVYRGFKAEITPIGLENDYTVKLGVLDKNNHVRWGLYGTISKADEKIQISLTVGTTPLFPFLLFIGILPMFILFLSTLGQSTGVSIFLITVAAVMGLWLWGIQKLSKRGFKTLFNDVFDEFSSSN